MSLQRRAAHTAEAGAYPRATAPPLSALPALAQPGRRSCPSTQLGLSPPTVSHHLAKLKELGLVRMRPDGTAHLYRLDDEALRAMSKDLLEPSGMASLVDDVEADAWERKVLRDFFVGEQLKEIPASRKKRAVVLRWLATRFEPGVRYPERELNDIIKRHHPDAATLRREIIGAGLMQREGGVYWRSQTAALPSDHPLSSRPDHLNTPRRAPVARS